MKYRTHNDEHINAVGTSHKSDFTTTYDKLVELFGEPRNASGDGKVDAEWKECLDITDGYFLLQR